MESGVLCDSLRLLHCVQAILKVAEFFLQRLDPFFNHPRSLIDCLFSRTVE